MLLSASPPALGDLATGAGRTLYSPIFPAYLHLAEDHTGRPDSVFLLFSPSPFWDLAALKPQLSAEEAGAVHMSHGWASLVILGLTEQRAAELAATTTAVAYEFWNCPEGALAPGEVVTQTLREPVREALTVEPVVTDSDELRLYLEQIYSCVNSLWAFYSQFMPWELPTLRAVVRLSGQLADEYTEMDRQASALEDLETALRAEKGRNAFQSALVELAAALSYAVTQGTTGGPPVLSSPSPFPHCSLLGVGGALRALTLFTRYLENAFACRSVFRVVSEGYSILHRPVPPSIAEYSSDPSYGFDLEGATKGGLRAEELFDRGGDFVDESEDCFPLITHFSLRHGFKESKFSVTAASESLSAEDQPQWTLMTLSHEIMHSRVRDIFRALFGSNWDNPGPRVPEATAEEFKLWYESDGKANDVKADAAIRNVVLSFCLAMDRASPVEERRPSADRLIDRVGLSAAYGRHRREAVELFVHFHDYYFVYARQPEVYALSLWGSWVRVAPPLARPWEYLVRTLATLACGTGSQPRIAFEGAAEILGDALDDLEGRGVRSPLFRQLRSILETEADLVFARFKPAYYLMDQIRLFFASSKIAQEIDRIREDEFSEGTEVADEYSANPYVLPSGNHRSLSPAVPVNADETVGFVN